jgi:dienelactone hydrolase
MAAQPDVNAKRLVIHGVSRGGEAALLVGATFPHLVSGVIAEVPSSNVGCGYPDCSQPAWTFGGKPVPFTRELGVTPPTDDPRAEIAVERITGRVLLSCAELDQIWPSCAYAKSIVARRVKNRLLATLRDCAACDHTGDLVPGEAFVDTSEHGMADRDEAVPFFTATLAVLASA